MAEANEGLDAILQRIRERIAAEGAQEFTIWQYDASRDESGFVVLNRERLIDQCVAQGVITAVHRGGLRSQTVRQVRKAWREAWNYHNEAVSEIQRRYDLAQRAGLRVRAVAL